MQSRGFTLIELLVVIAIIAVLIALLLPAVQQAREAARRTQCRNNLHQIMLGLHNYLDTHGVFPMVGVIGYIERVPAEARYGFHDGQYWSWLAMILPFMDEQPLYNAINFDLVASASNGQANSTVCRSSLAQFLCPSDPAGGSLASNYGRTNYAGPSTNHGYCAAIYYSGGKAQLFSPNWGTPICVSGSCTVDPCRRMRDVRDGTSNTLALGEIHDSYATSGLDSNNTNRWPSVAIVNWSCPNYRSTAGGINHYAPCASGGQQRMGERFYSLHEGGMFAAFIDGSVKFLSENMDYTTWRNLATLAGNEIVDDEDY